ncbi:MAG: 16S rRNA (adenine(1518)-N(6)/adenine(1519)-N(6))-dimethyltransferase RsmA [Patescibacteria group bacterium]|nr:16S rRNA (adenine(1518)-N(6)/adenine(1519)-N(6))-dimethyltransferase RsmA [Patescibacteria group bacterium]MDD4610751.1 16S rRNA (adenine(1518)-N(6)/adenine(1519)-N(6))-dimethyltransferase RsmA [Patescibacteria group bacterium]
MDILKQTKELCRIYDIHPARSKGQNFLISEEIYDKLIEAANLNKDDVVLEVGPGLGFLTAKLAQRAGRVIAVELDDKLAEFLKTGLKAQAVDNVEVINEDIIKANSLKLKANSYKVVANLPYNITSIFLRKVLEQEIKPSLMVLMLQKEVAERIIAKPPEMSILAISVQFYAAPKIIEIVKKENFWPQPEVESAIIELKVKSSKLKVDEKEFFRLVKIGFSAKRKMLKNNLVNGYHISQEEAEEIIKKAGFNSKIRAQELEVDDWKKLLEYFI